MGRLSGKVAAITGGASGIGEATVRLFVEEGAKVAFADRDVARGERLAAELQTAGGNTVQYDTTKAAVAGLTRAMARDHAADGIRVNAVGPGPIWTRFHELRAAESGRPLDAFKEEFGRESMLKRPGTPREVANCILFLASDDASFVTGTLLFVDGGKTAM